MALMTMEPAFGGSHVVGQRSDHSLGLRPTLASLAPEGRSRGLPRAVFMRSLRSTLPKTALGENLRNRSRAIRRGAERAAEIDAHHARQREEEIVVRAVDDRARRGVGVELQR